jgi:hypothetical protein
MSKMASSSRTSLTETCDAVLKLLAEEQKSYSITGLAKDTRLHRKREHFSIKSMLLVRAD